MKRRAVSKESAMLEGRAVPHDHVRSERVQFFLAERCQRV